MCCMLLSVAMPIYAYRPMTQQGGVVSLDNRVGYNAIFGVYSNSSATIHYSMPRHFMMRGGLQYSSIERITAEVRPACFYDLDFGRLSAELLLHYDIQNSINNLCTGVGVGITTQYVWVNIGYYYRYMLSDGYYLDEPFNLYYEVGVNCVPRTTQWDLTVTLTNSSLYDLERLYLPSLQLDALWYPATALGMRVGVAYKLAGMFHISNDFYQAYINFGISYRW